MHVKIEADGGPTGTRVLDDNGERIDDHVVEVVWRHRAGELPAAEVTLCCTPLNGHGEARMIGPNGKDVRSIQYMDGTEDRFDGVVPMVTHGDDRVRWIEDGCGGVRRA